MKIHVLEDNVCQHNLITICKSRVLVIGYIHDYYSSFGYTCTEGSRITEDLVLHDENAAYDSPNRWWRYRFFRLCTLPISVKYRFVGSETIERIRPTVWIRLNRIK